MLQSLQRPDEEPRENCFPFKQTFLFASTKEDVFHCYLFVCVSVGLQKKNARLMSTKLGGRVLHRPRKNPLSFGADSISRGISANYFLLPLTLQDTACGLDGGLCSPSALLVSHRNV